jgi:hypothetical protein
MGGKAPQFKSTLHKSPYFDHATEVTIARRWEDRFADRWEAAEPTFVAVLARLRRASGKMFQRTAALLVCAVVLTGVLTLYFVSRKPTYFAHVVFRVKDDGNSSLEATDKALADGIRFNYLTYGRLLQIIEHHNLYPSARKRAAYLAVEALREDLDVQAQRYEGEAEKGTRPLRVKIVFSHADAETARAVASDLADIVVAESRAALGAKHVLALKQTRAAADEAFRYASGMYRLAARPTGTGDQFRQAHLSNTLLDRFRERAAAELRATEDLADHSYEFMTVDNAVRAAGEPLRPSIALLTALIIAALVVSIGAILLGAGTEFVLDEKDIHALQLKPLATVSLPLPSGLNPRT